MSTPGFSEEEFSSYYFFFIDKLFVLNYDVIEIHNKVPQ